MSDQELFLISVPGDSLLDNRIKDVAEPFKIHVPKLQVGTFGSLISLSEELARLDGYIEANTAKLAQIMQDLVGDKAQHKDNLVVNQRTPTNYITRFEWNHAKYNIKFSLSELCKEISQRVSATEQEMKQRTSSYSKTKADLDAMNRKVMGSLLTRSLDGLVKREHFVLDSEFLVTLLVVVPKNLVDNWINKYEKLCDFVVPASSQKITEDSEYHLYTVTLFEKKMDDFKNAARDQRFVVRDFKFETEEIEKEREKKDGLVQDSKKKLTALLTWCKLSFGESFQAWMHIKVLRLFVESVLRYGLPVNFQAYAIQPHKSARRVRPVLEQIYSFLDKGGSKDAQLVDIPGLGMAAEYYPYVNIEMNLKNILH